MQFVPLRFRTLSVMLSSPGVTARFSCFCINLVWALMLLAVWVALACCRRLHVGYFGVSLRRVLCCLGGVRVSGGSRWAVWFGFWVVRLVILGWGPWPGRGLYPDCRVEVVLLYAMDVCIVVRGESPV